MLAVKSRSEHVNGCVWTPFLSGSVGVSVGVCICLCLGLSLCVLKEGGGLAQGTRSGGLPHPLALREGEGQAVALDRPRQVPQHRPQRRTEAFYL